MQWNLKTHDINAGKAALFLTHEMELHPVVIVEAIEVHPTIKVESHHITLDGNPSIYVPRELLGDISSLSLPVLLFNVLWGHASHVSYIWARLIGLRQCDPSSLSIVHQSMFIVGEWFAAFASNPPLVDSAMFVGRYDLRFLVSRFAYLLRLARPSVTSANKAIRDIMSTPWSMNIIDPFWDDFKSLVVSANICITPVKLAHNKTDAANPPGTYQCPDFILEKTVGLVCCPVDKIIAVAVLFLSAEFNMVRKANKDADYVVSHRVPPSLIPLLLDFGNLPSSFTPPPHYYASDPPRE